MKFKQKLYQAKADRAEALKRAEAAAAEGRMEDFEAEMARVKEFNGQIEQLEALLDEQTRFAGDGPENEGAEALKGKGGAGPKVEQEDKPKGYEAAVKSFAAAAKNGFQVDKAAGDYMSEGVDADGGYTVPQDIVTRIIALRESKESLLHEVRVIPVKTKSGRRTIKKRWHHQGFD